MRCTECEAETGVFGSKLMRGLVLLCKSCMNEHLKTRGTRRREVADWWRGLATFGASEASKRAAGGGPS